jgi:cell division protein FtsW (lipid II flippase)
VWASFQVRPCVAVQSVVVIVCVVVAAVVATVAVVAVVVATIVVVAVVVAVIAATVVVVGAVSGAGRWAQIAKLDLESADEVFMDLLVVGVGRAKLGRERGAGLDEVGDGSAIGSGGRGKLA